VKYAQKYTDITLQFVPKVEFFEKSSDKKSFEMIKYSYYKKGGKYYEKNYNCLFITNYEI